MAIASTPSSISRWHMHELKDELEREAHHCLTSYLGQRNVENGQLCAGLHNSY